MDHDHTDERVLTALDASWMPTVGYDTDDDQASEETPDRRSVDERRDQLVDAAVHILAEEGLARATTRNITDRAGLALGAFHYAFSSKDELLVAVMERVVRATEDALADATARGDDDTSDISALLARFWRFIEAEPELQLAKVELTVHALRDPELRPLASRQYERYVRAVGDAIAGPGDHDQQPLARYVVATLDGLVMQRLVEDDTAAAQERVELHVEAIESVAVQWSAANERADRATG
ncbi:MAG: TetR/AcrR family transcriptional regulator [Nitriliruptoraceae bacterium]|nr:TetR/AcrR family transcriptional regulator [Nitriliruptoraceae bacterium]